MSSLYEIDSHPYQSHVNYQERRKLCISKLKIRMTTQ